MANVLVNEQSLSGIAAAIRAKLGVQTTFKPAQMAAAIESIPQDTMPTLPVSGKAFYVYRESSMSVSVSDTQIQTVWSGGITIGAMTILPFAIPAGVKRISCQLSTGTSYRNDELMYLFAVGLRSTYSTAVVTAASSGFLAINTCSQRSMAETAFSLDCSAVAQDAYLYIMAHGWNATIRNITLHF